MYILVGTILFFIDIYKTYSEINAEVYLIYTFVL